MKILHESREIEVRDVDVLTAKEEWNEYQLGNGKVLKIKLVVSRVFESLDEKNQIGEPLYIVQSQNVVVVK